MIENNMHTKFLSKELNCKEYPRTILEKFIEMKFYPQRKKLMKSLFKKFNLHIIEYFYNATIRFKDHIDLKEFIEFSKLTFDDFNALKLVCAPMRFYINKKYALRRINYFDYKLNSALTKFLNAHRVVIKNRLFMELNEVCDKYYKNINIKYELKNIEDIVKDILILYKNSKRLIREIESHLANFYYLKVNDEENKLIQIEKAINLIKERKILSFRLSSENIERIFMENVLKEEDMIFKLIENNTDTLYEAFKICKKKSLLYKHIDSYYQQRKYKGLDDLFSMKREFLGEDGVNILDSGLGIFMKENEKNILRDIKDIDLYMQGVNSYLSSYDIPDGLKFICKYISRNKIEERYRELLIGRLLRNRVKSLEIEKKMISQLSGILFTYNLDEVLKYIKEDDNRLFIFKKILIPEYEDVEVTIPEEIKEIFNDLIHESSAGKSFRHKKMKKNREYITVASKKILYSDIKISYILTTCEIEIEDVLLHVSLLQYLILKELSDINVKKRISSETEAYNFLKKLATKLINHTENHRYYDEIIDLHLKPLFKNLIDFKTLEISTKYVKESNLIPEPYVKKLYEEKTPKKSELSMRLSADIVRKMKLEKSLQKEELIRFIKGKYNNDSIKIDIGKILYELENKGYLEIMDDVVNYIV